MRLQENGTRIYIPTEEELRAEIETQKEMFSIQVENKKNG